MRSENDDSRDVGGDPACWAHLFDDDATDESDAAASDATGENTEAPSSRDART